MPSYRKREVGRHVLFLLAANAMVLGGGGCTSPSPSESIDIGNRLELFVDSYLIDQMQGTRLVMHEPTLAPQSENPAPRGHYATVIIDNGIYRMYNRAADTTADGERIERTEVFESSDGINWSRPNLGLILVEGSLENNVVLAEAPFTHNFSPFLDTRPGIREDQRYKALAGDLENGLHAFVSADGLHWEKLRDTPVFTDGIFDSQNVSFWSEEEQMYVCYFRTWTGEGYTGLRSISRTTSDDFVEWTDPVAMSPTVEGEHLYTNATHPYYRAPHLYIALPTRFFPDRGNATDILFMTSRGGDTYDRTFKTAFLRPGLDSLYWTNRANYATLNVVPTGPEEMSIYVRGRRFTMRTDGFASVQAGFEEGVVQTKPLRFDGDTLGLNVSTSTGGYVLVELRDASDRPIPGYSLADADTLYGDAIVLDARWGGTKRIAGLDTSLVRVRYVMRDADIFSMSFR